MKLSAMVCVRNEEARLGACLDRLAFADELVVVLDRCTDKSRDIALTHKARLVEGAWEREGPRRNAGIEACTGDWILEIDADEHVTPELAAEIRRVADTSPHAIHLIPVDNWIGKRLVRRGWGASFGKGAYPGLYRKGAKRVGDQRLHPKLELVGSRGPMLEARLQHYLDRNLSDTIRRFDSYTTARAKDLKESGDIGSGAANVRRVFGRFWKCYVGRGGWREGGHGFLIAIFAGLYPLVSYLKAKYDDP